MKRRSQNRLLRLSDTCIAALSLIATAPLLLFAALAVFLCDGGPPFFMGVRIGKGGKPFRMVKLRTMGRNAWRSQVQSTSATDPRITRIGHLLRRYKLDELPQLWNVLIGDMALVGPRPQVPSEVRLYTAAERRMLEVRPGITDLASIVFSDEAEVLRGHDDPNDAYRRLIRPWKSRLALFSLERLDLDLWLTTLWLTARNIPNRRGALHALADWLAANGAPARLSRAARRQSPLEEWPPPESEPRMEALTGRPTHVWRDDALRSHLAGRTVAITGAAGSIGSELCRQVARLGARAVVALDYAETPLFHLDRRMRDEFPSVAFYPMIANVQSRRRIDEIFLRFRPDTVCHAAAYKHVPLMESHIVEAVENNVIASWNVARAAAEFEVEEFVLVSSDKAVHPVSVMGATKNAAERVCLAAGRMAGRGRFFAVRFGNVFASCGSVVPLFEEQIARGGPITITHEAMERYFMSVPEAAQLVLQAGVLAGGCEIFALEMGDPVRIVDLARAMIRESGRDIELIYTGVRPGEKLAERLWEAGESPRATQHPRIRAAISRVEGDRSISRAMEVLGRCCDARNEEGLILELQRLVPGYDTNGSLSYESLLPS